MYELLMKVCWNVLKNSSKVFVLMSMGNDSVPSPLTALVSLHLKPPDGITYSDGSTKANIRNDQFSSMFNSLQN